MTSETPRGLLFVMVGPGGTGKNTLMKRIMQRHPSITQLATATTREIRSDEVQGREHIFVSLERFREMIQNNELLEYQEVTPQRFYGIPRVSVDEKLSQGQHLIADIDVYGAKTLRKTYDRDTTLLFVTVPGETPAEQLDVLQERMVGRLEREPTPEDEKYIQQRLERARTLELPFAEECDYVIVNDTLEHATERLDEIITAKLNKHEAQTSHMISE